MRRAGFTLIEISIVLVIVGLIIGGIIVGQNMIRSAEIRATISQYDQFNILVKTFRIKYNALPGDMLPQQAANFGFLQLGGGRRCGDGNGVLEALGGLEFCGDPGGNSNTNWGKNEILTFWRHLSDAGLLDRTYGADLSSEGVSTSIPDVIFPGINYVPQTKLGRHRSWIVTSGGGVNFFRIFYVPDVRLHSGMMQYNVTYATTGPSASPGTGISPLEAFSIDTKIDNGMPNTGSVLAAEIRDPPSQGGTGVNAIYQITAPSVAVASQANKCTIGTSAATDTYNLVASTGGNDASCGLAFKFQ